MIDTVMYHNPMERKRQEHIKELIVTEQAYIEDMRLVHEVFFSVFFFLFFHLIYSCDSRVHLGYYDVWFFLSSTDSLRVNLK